MGAQLCFIICQSLIMNEKNNLWYKNDFLKESLILSKIGVMKGHIGFGFLISIQLGTLYLLLISNKAWLLNLEGFSAHQSQTE